MPDSGNEIVVVAFLGGAPDDDRADIEQGVLDVNRVLSSVGTLRPVETVPSPDDTRAIDVAALGSVCAAVLAVLPDLLAVVRSMQTWVSSRPGRTAKVVRPDGSSIELSDASPEDQRRLVDDWIRAGSGG